MKNARLPVRHRLAGTVGVGSACGIGMLTGRHFGSLVGSAMALIAGGRPISLRRPRVPHAVSEMHTSKHIFLEKEAKTFANWRPASTDTPVLWTPVLWIRVFWCFFAKKNC